MIKLLTYPAYAVGVDLQDRVVRLLDRSDALPIADPNLSMLLPLPGTGNFRDLGGIENQKGKKIRSRLVYRSDHLDFVPEKALRQLNIRTIIDFRSQAEMKKKRRWKQVSHHHLPIFQGDEVTRIRQLLLKSKTHPFDSREVLKGAYLYFVREAADQFAQFFQLLKSPSHYPLVFHCNAGKDRTGFATALLLRMLEVPQETILGDYLSTNEYRKRANRILIRKGSFFVESTQLRPLLEVEAGYLQAAFDLIDKLYGDFGAFCDQALHISQAERQAISNFLLQPGKMA